MKSALGETLSAGTVFAFVFSSPSGALVAYAGLDIIENATVKMVHPDYSPFSLLSGRHCRRLQRTSGQGRHGRLPGASRLN